MEMHRVNPHLERLPERLPGIQDVPRFCCSGGNASDSKTRGQRPGRQSAKTQSEQGER